MVSKNLRFWESLWMRGGYRFLPLKFFCLTLPRIFNRNTSVVQKTFVSKNMVCMRERIITSFRRLFFLSLYRKISLRTLRCFRKLLAAKTFFGCEGDITFLQQIFFCLTILKNFIPIFSLFQKNFLSSKFFNGLAGQMSFSLNIFFVSRYR